jgi:hypothetical protein
MENDRQAETNLERRYSEHTDKKLKWERLWPESKLKTTNITSSIFLHDEAGNNY